ncbi:MAG: triose-phosphate isomerase [Bacillota bacterium]|nr:triose-phosphate isomerase [Bacillota bacterium]
MRQLAVGTNIKMYLGYRDTVAWMEQLAGTLGGFREVELFAFVPAVCLVDAGRILGGTPVGYGAQNMHWAEAGPYTGELSAGMLKELGCTHVELGHMERRRYFGETDREVNRKLRRALDSGLRAVVCLGEEGRAAETEVRRHLERQLEVVLAGVDPAETGDFLLAYEPAWAIGVDEAASPGYVEEMHAHLRRTVAGLLGQAAAERLKIVYGGSVTPDTAGKLCRLPDVDGLFVGRSALDVERFRGIIEDASHWHNRATD